MKIILLLALFLLSKIYFAQDSLFVYEKDKRTPSFGAVCAYYFWELDSLLYIKKETYNQAFLLNQKIELQGKKSLLINEQKIDSVKNVVRFYAFNPKEFEKVNSLPLTSSVEAKAISVVYEKEGNVLNQKVYQNVLYFNLYTDSTLRFSHDDDSIKLVKSELIFPVKGHFIVKRFWNDYGELVDEQVFSFSGKQIEYCEVDLEKKAQHLIIFSNGYRGRKKEKKETDNLITRKDRYHYWLRLDKAFVKTIKPDDYFYIDGHHSIRTSNHLSKVNFSLSYSKIKALVKSDKNAKKYDLLNFTSNVEGFYQRKKNGQIAGNAFLASRNENTCFGAIKDSIDIVCHSMGYAYALGFIETVKDFVVFRNFYIIAPENASAGSCDWTMFQEVWQYGTHIEGEDAEAVWKQDGIAPQKSIPELDKITIGGRVYFPKDYKRMNFVNSHMLNHYRWIFKEIDKGQKGFVH